MRACILSIGSELILGQITDTNATFLAQELSAVGIDLVYVTQVGDDPALLLDAMRRSLQYADLLICTGGIGPTDDDLTRETIAELVGEEPTLDAELLADLTNFFRGRGQDMPQRNRKQAWVIPSSTVLPNPIGTAPGWLVDTDGKMIVTMPGVPREMYRMWSEQALPRILERAENRVIDSVNIKTIGIGESAAEDLLHDLVVAADPQVATYAKDDGVHVRVTAFGEDPAEARQRRDACRAEVLERLGAHVWGEDGDTLQSVVARELDARGTRLLIHEMGTGGALSSLLAADPASSTVFLSDLVEPALQASEPAVGRAVRNAASLLTANQEAIGVALIYEGVLDERGVSHGQLTVAISDPAGQAPSVSTAQMRASLPEVQRRSALSAIEALRHFLKR
ncbi:MAG TPA: CinA family nicotinamide mononucleotide deamidase-related protein [Thermomicrobiales bacterium]|nr:CinA family nicotinamide mononucleotide deamidase-related protein [Thermomicrobiales bacterium]